MKANTYLIVTTACWGKADIELWTIDGRDIGRKLRDLGCAYAEEVRVSTPFLHEFITHYGGNPSCRGSPGTRYANMSP